MTENGMRSVSGDHDDYSNGHNDEHCVPVAIGENGKIRLNEIAQKYIQDLLAEKLRMENQFPLAAKLIDDALEKVQTTGRIPARETYADVYQQRTIKLSQKVHVPIKDKKFNYVGKLLGPKGNSLRRLQEETQCKIVILGRFSMKDRAREEELRNSSDTKYAHLNLPLHVEVSTIAPPAEAYARVAYALAEIRKYLIPDKHDDIRQEQFRELMEDPEAAKKIAIRQQQQAAAAAAAAGSGGIGHSGGGGSGGPNHPNHRGGNFRPKYQPPSQHYHHTEDAIYYRSHNNNYHQPKPFVQASPRANPMHSSIQPLIANQNSGMPMNTPNYSGRGNGSNGGGVGNGGGGGGGGGMRYRPVPYQFAKNK